MKLGLLLPRAAGAAGKYYSGGDLYDAELARALERRGHRVDVIRTPARFDPATWAKRLIARDYAAVLQDELGHVPYLALNRALRGRVPAVAVVHVTRARLEPAARSAAAERAYLRSVASALFVSRQVRRDTERLLEVRVRSRVAHPGSDHVPPASQRTAARAAAVRFVSVGHLLPHKGQLELVQAFAEVDGRCRLSLAGDARDRGYAARVRAAAARLGTRVRWLGPLAPRPLARALSRADVFVTASRYESYGIAAAEALACGLPVVSWAEGGLWEFLSPGENALRVKPGDSAGLTRALSLLCSDRALLARLQRGARSSAQQLPRWDDAAAQAEALLRAALVRDAHTVAHAGTR